MFLGLLLYLQWLDVGFQMEAVLGSLTTLRVGGASPPLKEVWVYRLRFLANWLGREIAIGCPEEGSPKLGKSHHLAVGMHVSSGEDEVVSLGREGQARAGLIAEVGVEGVVVMVGIGVEEGLSVRIERLHRI